MTSKKIAAYGAQDENQKSKKLNQLNCVVCYEDVCKPFCRFDDCPAVGFKCGVCADNCVSSDGVIWYCQGCEDYCEGEYYWNLPKDA